MFAITLKMLLFQLEMETNESTLFPDSYRVFLLQQKLGPIVLKSFSNCSHALKMLRFQCSLHTTCCGITKWREKILDLILFVLE